ncbi:MAG: hypothetical protein IJV40_03600 [Oscillospiraceae bacterium]|nr:hypothetical protein [Oscillospiraceae bacterium]
MRRLNRENRDKIYAVAIKEYGKMEQLGVLIEEMSELQKEVCKLVFRGAGNMNHVAEEAADVVIMLEQLDLMFPGIKDAIAEHRDRKVRRLAENLKMEV